MAAIKQKIPQVSQIKPININGLHGRLLYTPAFKRNQGHLLIVYGHRSYLEQWQKLAEWLSKNISVTVVDLPGFGGMESFYKIGEKPSLDNYADYLAAFVKLRFKKQKFSIAGASFGFLVVTRMLQRFPEMAGQVDNLISVAGFSHYQDFAWSRQRLIAYRALAGLLSSGRLGAGLFSLCVRNPLTLHMYYWRTFRQKKARAIRQVLVAEQLELWRHNDSRTWLATLNQMLKADNCQIALPMSLHHLRFQLDLHFDRQAVIERFKVIFPSLRLWDIGPHLSSGGRRLTLLAEPGLLPTEIKNILSAKRLPKRSK